MIENAHNSNEGGNRNILILAIRQDEVAAIGPMNVSTDEEVDMFLQLSVGEIYREYHHKAALDKYIFFDWHELSVIKPKAKISEISWPGILILVPKIRHSKMENTAHNIKEKAIQSEFRETIWSQVESVIYHESKASANSRYAYAKKLCGSKDLTDKKVTRHILILGVWEKTVAPFHLFISNRDTCDALVIPNRMFDVPVFVDGRFTIKQGILPTSEAEDFVLLDWQSLNVVPTDDPISVICRQGIVFRLPKAPVEKLRSDAKSIIKWVMTTPGSTQDFIFLHITTFRFLEP